MMDMKDKRIWVVIGCILVLGSTVTYYTSSYIKDRSGSAAAMTMAAKETGIQELVQTARPDTVRGPEEAASSEEGKDIPEAESGTISEAAAAAVPGLPEESAIAEDRGAAQKKAVAAEAAVISEDAMPKEAGSSIARSSGAGPGERMADIQQEEPISPLSGGTALEETTTADSDYVQRLKDLDTQIQKIRSEETDSNVYSIKTSAETELKMWEAELSTVYNALLTQLSEEEAAKLAKEQQDWLYTRDRSAAENSQKGSSSIEPIGYAATMVKLTRERAYELAERYKDTAKVARDGAELKGSPGARS